MERKPLDPNDIKTQLDDLEAEARVLAEFIQDLLRSRGRSR